MKDLKFIVSYGSLVKNYIKTKFAAKFLYQQQCFFFHL